MKGTGEYPDNWSDLAGRFKADAGYRCVRCGHHDDPAVCLAAGVERGRLACDSRCRGHEPDARKRVLTVHHLDGDKGNCRWWNCPPLCQVCHLVIQAKVRMEQLYIGEHSDWFKPYYAGWIAFNKLREDLTREQVGRRMDELLAAGQPWRAA